MDPTLVYDLWAPCGCHETLYYDDDPEFDGYETDREEKTRTLCESHKNRVRELEATQGQLRGKLDELRGKLDECNEALVVLEREISRGLRRIDSFDQ